jgi:hypothetical protein
VLLVESWVQSRCLGPKDEVIRSASLVRKVEARSGRSREENLYAAGRRPWQARCRVSNTLMLCQVFEVHTYHIVSLLF